MAREDASLRLTPPSDSDTRLWINFESLGIFHNSWRPELYNVLSVSLCFLVSRSLCGQARGDLDTATCFHIKKAQGLVLSPLPLARRPSIATASSKAGQTHSGVPSPPRTPVSRETGCPAPGVPKWASEAPARTRGAIAPSSSPFLEGALRFGELAVTEQN